MRMLFIDAPNVIIYKYKINLNHNKIVLKSDAKYN